MSLRTTTYSTLDASVVEDEFSEKISKKNIGESFASCERSIDLMREEKNKGKIKGRKEICAILKRWSLFHFATMNFDHSSVQL
jgi:hypothetical protein